MKLLRQILSILIVSAYVGTAMTQIIPAAAAAGTGMGAMSMSPDADGKLPPCRGAGPDCMTEVGCVFLVSLPAPPVLMSATLVWSSIRYEVYRQIILDGRLIEPALRPPNSVA